MQFGIPIKCIERCKVLQLPPHDHYIEIEITFSLCALLMDSASAQLNLIEISIGTEVATKLPTTVFGHEQKWMNLCTCAMCSVHYTFHRP